MKGLDVRAKPARLWSDQLWGTDASWPRPVPGRRVPGRPVPGRRVPGCHVPGCFVPGCCVSPQRSCVPGRRVSPAVVFPAVDHLHVHLAAFRECRRVCRLGITFGVNALLTSLFTSPFVLIPVSQSLLIQPRLRPFFFYRCPLSFS